MPRDTWLKKPAINATLPSDTQPKKASKAKQSKSKPSSKPSSRSMADTADKHALYQTSVQSPSSEITTLLSMYTTHAPSSRHPTHFQEDFCGTAILSREFIKRDPRHTVTCVDIDESVVEYAKRLWVRDVDPDNHDHENDQTDGSDENDNKVKESAKRVHLVCGDVREERYVREKADIICALNYGIFYFKKRKELVRYFERCFRIVQDDGMIVCDVFGGAQVETQKQAY